MNEKISVPREILMAKTSNTSSAAHIPIELMQTFVKLVECQGDATSAAKALNISQPSTSRRLSALRDLVGTSEDRPWLILKGKRWILTPTGERVYGTVADLVRKYEQVERFIAENQAARPSLSIACGQTAAGGLVKRAVEALVSEHTELHMRIATVRGKSRIEGVVGGQFDLAIVTESEASIEEQAGIELHTELLFSDRFLVAANPPAKARWTKEWESLPVRRPLQAKDLVDLPMLLPEQDASRRRQFDEWFQRGAGRLPNTILEVGGWHNLLRYSQAGLGLALATEQSLQSFESTPVSRSSARSSLSIRYLDEQSFRADEARLIARKRQGQLHPDLSGAALRLVELLREFSRRP